MLLGRLRQAIIHKLRTEQAELDQLRSRPVLRDPTGGFGAHYEWLALTRHRLATGIKHRLAEEANAIEQALRAIRTMSPRATLERGYAILADAEGRSVTSVHEVAPGDQLQVYLRDGQLPIEVGYQEDA